MSIDPPLETENKNPASTLDQPVTLRLDRDKITEAAKALGTLPKELFKGHRKERRVWTGFVGRERTWMAREVILPEGTPAWIVEVKRGMATVLVGQDETDGSPVGRRVAAAYLTIWRRPEAILLGRFKKGIKEQPSQRKAESSRRNGTMPVRPGNRPRGRPSKRPRLDSASAVQSILVRKRGPYKVSLKRLITKMLREAAQRQAAVAINSVASRQSSDDQQVDGAQQPDLRMSQHEPMAAVGRSAGTDIAGANAGLHAGTTAPAHPNN